MSNNFDPYHKWLGIAPSEQPPNHYRLLGLNLFESDLDVIESGSDRQMAHLRSFQTGPRMRECQRLLNEVAAARVLLLNAQRKSVYDQLLQSTFMSVEAPPSTTAVPLPSVVSQSETTSSETTAAPAVVSKGSWHRRNQAVSQNALVAGGIIGLVVLFAIGFGIRKAFQQAPPPVAQLPPAEPTHREPSIEAVVEPVVSPVETQQIDPPSSVPITPAVTASNLPPPSETMAPPPTQVVADSQPREMPAPSGSLGDLVNAPAASKLPIPAAPELQAARQQIQRLFAGDLDKQREPQESAKLADKLIDEASKSGVQPSVRYALLESAIDVASKGGAVTSAARAINEIDGAFVVDLVQLKGDAVQQIAGVAQQAWEHKAVVELLEPVIAECLAEDRFNLATSLAETAMGAARKSKDSFAITHSVAQSREVKTLSVKYEPVQAALDLLAAGSDTAEANETVGRHLCLVKGQWARGLPYLVKSNSSELREVAARDIRNSTNPDTQAEIGNDWMNAATQLEQSLRLQALLRAEYWYRLAAAQQSGLKKVSLESSITALGKDIGELAKLPSGAVLVMTFEPSTLKKQGYVMDVSQHGYVGAVKGAVLTDGIAGKALGFDGKDDFVEIASTPWLSAPSALTFAAWVNVVAWKNTQYADDFVLSNESGSGRGYIMRYGNGGNAVVTVGVSPSYYDAVSIKRASLGEWHHMAATFDGTIASIFLDGELEGNKAVPGAITPSDVPFRIGQSAHSKGRGTYGRIDEVAIFNRALSPEEVRTVYRIGLAGRPLME